MVSAESGMIRSDFANSISHTGLFHLRGSGEEASAHRAMKPVIVIAASNAVLNLSVTAILKLLEARELSPESPSFELWTK